MGDVVKGNPTEEKLAVCEQKVDVKTQESEVNSPEECKQEISNNIETNQTLDEYESSEKLSIDEDKTEERTQGQLDYKPQAEESRVNENQAYEKSACGLEEKTFID